MLTALDHGPAAKRALALATAGTLHPKVRRPLGLLPTPPTTHGGGVQLRGMAEAKAVEAGVAAALALLVRWLAGVVLSGSIF